MGAAGIHHVALACRDPEATRAFYEDALGFPLVHTEIQEGRGAFVKHFFFDLGGDNALAFFQLSNAGEPADLKTAISTDLGLPEWVNHVAFKRDKAELDAVKARAADHDIKPTMELDHGWCTSLYFTDPNGILVEFCADNPGMPVDMTEARELLAVVPPS